MKLRSMSIQNFRQFHGEQEMEFALGGETGKNITVVHGYNGSGKTALLNAFIWCLYGETTPDLEHPDLLHNERAVAEAKVGEELVVSVLLEFELHDGRYRIRRTRKCVKDGVASLSRPTESIELYRTGSDGNLVSIGTNDDAKQKRIEQFLPKTLYPFFFFNGERVERLASADAYDDVEAGVKTLLDIEIFERGERHLSTPVARALRNELQSLGGGEFSSAIDDLKTLEQTSDRLVEQRTQHNRNIKAIGQEVEKIKAIQSTIEALAELAKKQKRLSADLSSVDDDIVEARKAMARSLSKNGYLSFGEGVLAGTEELVRGARQRGEIPAKIKPQFVDDLIAQHKCVCGRPIQPGSPEHDCLLAWRNATGLAEFEEQISQTSAQVRPLRERRDSYFESLDLYYEKTSVLLQRRKDLKEQLDLIREELGDPAHGEDAARLQARLNHLEKQRNEEQASVIICDRDIAENTEKQDELNRRIKKLKVQDKRANLVRRQLAAVENVARAFKEIAIVQKDDVRAALSASIKSIWEDAAIKDYSASVSEDYRLMLTKRVGGSEQPVVGASTGEKQVLALSFVGSLVKKARDNASEAQGIRVGGQYPLVMDSPFGALEDDYRAKVAEWVPMLADQVIVIVSMSQWRNEVENAMRGRIGREYILELHTSKTGRTRDITVRGEKRPYVVSSNDPNERTMIRRV